VTQRQLLEAQQAASTAKQQQATLSQRDADELRGRLENMEIALADTARRLSKSRDENASLLQRWRAIAAAITEAKKEARKQYTRRMVDAAHVCGRGGEEAQVGKGGLPGVLAEEMMGHELRVLEGLARLLTTSPLTASPLLATADDRGRIAPARTQPARTTLEAGCHEASVSPARATTGCLADDYAIKRRERRSGVGGKVGAVHMPKTHGPQGAMVGAAIRQLPELLVCRAGRLLACSMPRNDGAAVGRVSAVVPHP